jgi:glycosyltransferase involved in cell wall biosynthesis
MKPLVHPIEGKAIASGSRILIVSDAWKPQVNGVVRTLEWLVAEAPGFGVEIIILTPDLFRSIPMPTYPEIRLSLTGASTIAALIDEINPDAIHIATEGPLGFFTRLYCLERKRPFTTCYHTRFPEYLAARYPIPKMASYALLRQFHNAAAATLVATNSLKTELTSHGFSKLKTWRRGIDLTLFNQGQSINLGVSGPVFLYVGRIAIEKNIEAFLKLDLPGTKIVVGEGPARLELQAKFPKICFLGVKSGQDLASIYASADVFVFPSRTDTFGLVMLEALAAGTPVAAFPVSGPMEVLEGSRCGIMSEDLRLAALMALEIPREACKAFASRHSIRDSAADFFSHIAAAQLARRM